MTEPTTAGAAYDAELIRRLRTEFDLEDYDAEAAANDAAKEIPQLGKFVRAVFIGGETRTGKSFGPDLAQMLKQAETTGEENQS